MKYQKTFTKTKTVIGRGKRSNTLNEVKQVESINKHPQGFIKINLSCIKQEHQDSLIQGKIHIQPRILVKLRFKEL